MSVGYRLVGLRHLVEFLRWCAQPQFGYIWQNTDRFLVGKTKVGTGRRKGEEYEIVIWLPDAHRGEEPFAQVFELISSQDKSIVDQVDESKSWMRNLSFTELLKSFPVVRRRPNRRSSLNLLVALYQADRQVLARVLESVQRNPDHPLEVLFLDKRDSETDGRAPKFLIRLPMADSKYQWSLWLESEIRRESADGAAQIKLFNRLGESANAEFYVEYGFAHPVPEIIDLYPNERGANPILIEGQGFDSADRTRWVSVEPDPSDTQVQFQGSDGESLPVNMQLESEQEVVCYRVPRTIESVSMTPRLNDIGRERREGLASVEARIHGTQKILFQLQQQRTALLAERNSRFRILLLFEQRRGENETVPAISDDFQQFLLMSRRQLDRYDYFFLESDTGPQYHVVLTRSAVFWQDVPTTLASEVYYQPYYWENWPTRNLFVRYGVVLHPAIDDESMATGLATSLSKTVTQMGSIILIDASPTAESKDEIQLRSFPAPSESSLAKNLLFINRSYPLTELKSRKDVRRELLAALHKCQTDLEAEVEAIETKLRQQAALRLDRLHEDWNTLAPKIDTAARHLETCHDSYGTFSSIMDEFSIHWRAFVDNVLKFNHSLIETKLEVLARLGREEKVWAEKLTQVEEGHQHVQDILVPVEGRIKERIRKAHQTLAAASDKFKRLAQIAKEADRELSNLCDEMRKLQQSADQRTGKIRKWEAEYQERHEALQNLAAELKELRKKLVKHRDGFRDLLQLTRRDFARVNKSHQALVAARKKCDELPVEWKKSLAKFAGDLKQLKEKASSTKDEIDALGIRGQQYSARAKKLVAGVQKSLDQVIAQRDSKRDETAAVQRELTKVKNELVLLEEAAKHLQAARSKLSKEKKNKEARLALLREEARKVTDVLHEVRAERDDEMQAILAEWNEVDEALARLSELETMIEPCNSFRDAIRVRQGATTAYHKFRSLAGVDGNETMWTQVAN